MIALFEDVCRLLIHIVRNVKLLTDNRLDTVGAKHGHERMRAVHIAVIGDSHCVHTPCLKSVAKRMRFDSLFGVVGIWRNLQKPHRPVQKTVFGM